MKKALGYLLAILFSLCVVIPGTAEDIRPQYHSMHDEPSFQFSSIAAVMDTLYAIKGDKLIRISPDQKSETILVLDSVYASSMMLFSSEESIFLISPDEGKLYTLIDMKLQENTSLDLSSLGEPDEHGLHIPISNPVIINDYLYFLLLNHDTWKYDLYQFSLHTGDYKIISNASISPSALIPYKNGQLLVQDQETNQLFLIDPESYSVSNQIILSIKDHFATSVIYNEHTDQFFYLSGTKLLAQKKNSIDIIDLLPFSVSESYAVSTCLWNNQYTLCTAGNLYVCDGSGTSSDKIHLNVWITDLLPSYQGHFREFMTAYPDIRIITHTYDNIDSLLSVMDANNDTYADLFLVPSYQTSSHALFQQGFAAMIQSGKLKDSVKSMYPQIQEYLALDDKLYGFPILVEPNGWSVRTSLAEQSGISSLPVTVEEYIDLMINWYKDYSVEPFGFTFDEYPDMDLHIRTLIYHYILTAIAGKEKLSFNTTEFTSVMEKLSSLKEIQSIVPSENYYTVPSIFSSTDSDLSQDMVTYYGFPSKEFFTPPVFRVNQTPIMDAYIFYFMINSRSDHKSEAELYLSFISDLFSKSDSYILYPDIDEPEESESYSSFARQTTQEIKYMQDHIDYLANRLSTDNLSEEDQNSINEQIQYYNSYIDEWKEYLKDLEEERWLYSPDTIYSYKKAANYLFFLQDVDILNIIDPITDIFMEYIEGNIYLDDAVNQADHMLSTLLSECN